MDEEKLPFLKREDIKTMAKDIAKLQEGDALKEREKIGQLKPGEKPAVPLIPKEQEETTIADTFIPKPALPTDIAAGEPAKIEESLLPKAAKPSSLQKVAVRLFSLLLILLFFFLIIFGIWFLVKRKPPQTSPTPSPTASQSASPEPSNTPPEVIIPSPLVPIQKTKVVDLSAEAKLRDALSEVIGNLASTAQAGELIQVVVKKNGAFLGFTDFLGALEIKAPSAVLEGLSTKAEDFTLFLYSQAGKARFGFLVKTTDNDKATTALKSWETTLEKDWETLFTLIGKTKPALVASFRDAKYVQIPFRYQTFSKEDLGICYSILNNKLIFTSSSESLKKVIDLVKANQ